MAEPMELVLTGERGQYRAVEALPFATGRNSACYRVQASGPGLLCAKVFREVPKKRAGAPAPEEFISEIRARSRLVHPNILPIVDFGSVDGGGHRPFLVMPLCHRNLRQLLERRDFLPLEELLPILRQVASAVDHGHDQGVIHGDIKPENILLDEDGHAFLSDFGVSRFFSFDEPIGTIDAAAHRGSTAYLSPEQVSDDKQSHRSDIYSLATVAYELACGALPFDRVAPTYRQMAAKVAGEHRDPRLLNPGLPEHFYRALEHGLAVRPHARPASARTLFAELSGQAESPSADKAEKTASAGAGWWDRLDNTQRVAVITAIITVLGAVITAAIAIVPDLLGQ